MHIKSIYDEGEHIELATCKDLKKQSVDLGG